MQNVRDQSLLLLDLPIVDHRMNTMRLWESLKWSQRMRKGLRIDSEFQDAEEATTGETGEMLGAESHGVGGFHGGFRQCYFA